MNIVIVGTNHWKNEDAVGVVLQSEGEDTWTFTAEGINFTITGLTKAMDFLRSLDSE